jgi:hypothetical protein
MVRQNIIKRKVYGIRVGHFMAVKKQGKKDKRELKTRYSPQGHAPSELLPPGRHYVLLFPELPKLLNQLKTMPSIPKPFWEDISYPNINNILAPNNNWQVFRSSHVHYFYYRYQL